jgi:hypothetical protein
MTVQDVAAIAAVTATLLGGATAMMRFMIKHYLSELKPNGGSSVSDRISRVENRVDDIYRLLCERSTK